jgi:hypothetical protein
MSEETPVDSLQSLFYRHHLTFRKESSFPKKPLQLFPGNLLKILLQCLYQSIPVERKSESLHSFIDEPFNLFQFLQAVVPILFGHVLEVLQSKKPDTLEFSYLRIDVTGNPQIEEKMRSFRKDLPKRGALHRIVGSFGSTHQHLTSLHTFILFPIGENLDTGKLALYTPGSLRVFAGHPNFPYMPF